MPEEKNRTHRDRREAPARLVSSYSCTSTEMLLHVLTEHWVRRGQLQFPRRLTRQQSKVLSSSELSHVNSMRVSICEHLHATRDWQPDQQARSAAKTARRGSPVKRERLMHQNEFAGIQEGPEEVLQGFGLCLSAIAAAGCRLLAQ